MTLNQIMDASSVPANRFRRIINERRSRRDRCGVFGKLTIAPLGTEPKRDAEIRRAWRFTKS